MTDQSPQTADPVEDRLRRTFATRADDMAPGDGAAGDPGIQLVLARSADPGSDPRRVRRSSRPLLAAAVVVVVMAAAAAGVVVANGDDDDAETGELAADGDGEPSPTVVELITTPWDLVIALQDERNLASIELIGQADMVELAVDDTGEARARTDAAVAELGSLVAADAAASPYRAALDGLDGLAALRSDIDADDGPQDLSNIDTADEVFARYAQLVVGLLDAQGEVALTVDDPELRAGAQVFQLGLRQQELTAQLVRTTVGAAIEPGSAALTELSRLYELVRQGQDALVAQATGTPYEEATVVAVSEVEASGLLDAVAAAMEGTPDISAILVAVDLSADEGWLPFLSRVEQILTAAG